jgi:hypothetical protein
MDKLDQLAFVSFVKEELKAGEFFPSFRRIICCATESDLPRFIVESQGNYGERERFRGDYVTGAVRIYDNDGNNVAVLKQINGKRGDQHFCIVKTAPLGELVDDDFLFRCPPLTDVEMAMARKNQVK